MSQVTGSALGLVVFSIGVATQFMLSAGDEDKPSLPVIIRILSVLTWLLIALVLHVGVPYVQKTGQPITIPVGIVFSIAALLFGGLANLLLYRLSGYIHARRGGRAFQAVMRQKEGRATNEHWRQQQG